LSRSPYRQETAQCHAEFISFERQIEDTPRPFSEGLVPHHAEEYSWTELSSNDAPMPFAAPAWEIPGPSATPETSSAQLQEAVQEQIQAILQEAKREAQQIKEEAYAAGFAAGEQEGFEAGQQRAEVLLQQLGQALHAVGELRGQIFAQSEHQLLELTLAIAKKVLHHEGRINRDALVPLVHAGINSVSQRQEVRVKVHPNDLLFTASCKAHLLSSLDGVETILFEEDASVPPGSYIVEPPTEIIDLRWDEQLAEVATRLLEASTLTCQEVEA
jgi:flagellar assembly protein FliH